MLQIFMVLCFVAYVDAVATAAGEAMPVKSEPINSAKKTQKKTFKIVMEKVSWQRAERKCAENNTHLASVRSQQENDELQALLDKSHNAWMWIGANDLVQEGRFTWSADGSALAYTNWRRYQPNNYGGEQDCVQLTGAADMEEPTHGDGQWWDLECADQVVFACETIDDR